MPTSHNNSNHESVLIQQVIAGNRRSFEELCEPYHSKLLQRALHMVGSAEDAQDVLQEAFLKSFQAIASFRAEAKFETWLTQIVINEARMCLRRYNRKHFSRLSPEMEQELVCCDQDAHNAFARTQRLQALRRSIADLPEIYREAVELRLRDLSTRESSAILAISVPALKSRHSRAMSLLRARLHQGVRYNATCGHRTREALE